MTWSNYETMTIALWIESENSDYKKALIEKSLSYPQYSQKLIYLSEAIEAWIESSNPISEQDNSVFGTLINDSLARICWHEIAEKWIG